MTEQARQSGAVRLCAFCETRPRHALPSGVPPTYCAECRRATQALARYWIKMNTPLRSAPRRDRMLLSMPGAKRPS